MEQDEELIRKADIYYKQLLDYPGDWLLIPDDAAKIICDMFDIFGMRYQMFAAGQEGKRTVRFLTEAQFNQAGGSVKPVGKI